jgi:Co/Zn/Cd efflux system component
MDNLTTYTYSYDYRDEDITYFAKLHYVKLTTVLIITLVGLITNTLCLLVFRRYRHKTVINFLLQCLAVSDIVILVLQCVFQLSPFFLEFSVNKFLIMSTFNNMINVINVWITVTVCCFRYIAICHPFHETRLCTLTRAKLCIVLITMVSAVGSGLFGVLQDDFLPTSISGFILDFIIWMHYTISLFIPLVVMSYMCTRIIFEICKMQQGPGFSRNHTQVTIMLIAVIVMMLFSRVLEVLDHILYISWRGIFKVYIKYALLLWLLHKHFYLLNSSINLFIYLICNTKFRRVFLNRFRDTST